MAIVVDKISDGNGFIHAIVIPNRAKPISAYWSFEGFFMLKKGGE